MQTMLITGTTQGIGNAIYNYYKDSFRIITVNRREFEGNNYICDLYDINSVVDLANEIKKIKIDVLINNAGGGEPVLFQQLNSIDLLNCTNLNYHAPVLLMQAVLEGMRQRGYGRVINISSIASKSPRPLIPHYGAAKSALEKFSSSMAVTYAESGITINCLCPGGVQTETSIKNRKQMAILQGLEEDYYNNDIANKNGLGRMVYSSEIVKFVEFILSDSANAISGQVFNICGTREIH